MILFGRSTIKRENAPDLDTNQQPLGYRLNPNHGHSHYPIFENSNLFISHFMVNLAISTYKLEIIK